MDVLALALPSISPRSRLYHLEPVGLKSPYVECLTSYFTRLARAHCTSNLSLYKGELEPLLRKGWWLGHSRKVSCHSKVMSRIYQREMVNGSYDQARTWVEALEYLTLRDDLSFLTALTWGNSIYPHSFFFRKSSAWCPSCFEEWHDARKTIYQPLLWMFNAVSICPQHKRALARFCVYCKKSPKILANNARPGHCSYCQQWLGNSDRTDNNNLTIEIQYYWKHQLWLANTISEWIAFAQCLSSPPSRDETLKAIAYCIDNLTSGNASDFARLIGCSHSTVSQWLCERSLPRFDLLLKICSITEVSLTDFLTGQVILKNSFHKDELRTNILRKALKPSRRTQKVVLQTLKSALQELPPPSLAEIAIRLSYKCCTFISRKYPEICKNISKKYALYHWSEKEQQMYDGKAAKQALEFALKQSYPPSPTTIALSFNSDQAYYLYKRFPELCDQINLKRANYKANLNCKIEAMLKAALEEEPPPSINDLLKRLGIKDRKPVKCTFPALYTAVKERHAKWRNLRKEGVEQNLLKALMEDPPPSLTLVSNRYHYHLKVLYKKFPKLSHAISFRHAEYKRECTKRKRELFRKQIREIGLELCKLGIHPSKGQVVSRLINLPGKDRAFLTNVLRDLRRELGIPDYGY